MGLLTSRVQRVHFDPKNKAHLQSLRTFLETGSWGDVKFACEAPYLNVPEYVLRKYAAHQLKCRDVTAAEAPVQPKAKSAEAPAEAVKNVTPLLKKVA